MFPTPSTLADCFAVCSGCRFRVRHVETLEDYVIMIAKSYSPMGYPSWFGAIRLDGGLIECDLSGQFRKYGLLSSTHERRFLNSLLESELRRLFINYPNPPQSCSCEECQFGEG